MYLNRDIEFYLILKIFSIFKLNIYIFHWIYCVNMIYIQIYWSTYRYICLIFPHQKDNQYAGLSLGANARTQSFLLISILLFAHLINDRMPVHILYFKSQFFKKSWQFIFWLLQGKPVEGFHDVYQQIVASPSKNYLLFVICSIIGVFFLVGITCGRVSKRVAKQNKMK